MVNHILTVRGRTASISPRTLVQGTVGQDTLTLDLDSEWNGLNVTVTFVAATTEVTPTLNANVCEVPHEVLVDSGEVDVFVLGTRDGKAMRHASLAHKMVVKKSNMSDGSTTADPSISAYRQAYDDAVKATEAANSAAGAAGSTAATMDALNKRYSDQMRLTKQCKVSATRSMSPKSSAPMQRLNAMEQRRSATRPKRNAPKIPRQDSKSLRRQRQTPKPQLAKRTQQGTKRKKPPSLLPMPQRPWTNQPQRAMQQPKRQRLRSRSGFVLQTDESANESRKR